jgi:N-acetylglucosamine kinase-like BadF-type ATPase
VRLPAILAVDGGGSKVDAALLRRDGTLLGAVRIVSSEHDGSGGNEHLEIVADAIGAAARDASIDPSLAPVAEVGVYCLAGADLPADDRRIARWTARRGFTAEDLVRNDTFAVLRAGTERPWGVAVVCGYGTNCAGLAPDGRITRFPAVGSISGDWGGGHDIGAAGLWYAMRSEDGRGEKTSLERIVPAHFGLKRPRQVLEAIYFRRLDEDRVVELTPEVFGAAGEGDPVARSILDRQADEVVAMAGTAIRRLRMTKLDVDVVLGGGIFRNDDELFLKRIEEGLRAVAPDSQMHVLTAPPVIGAALMGLDHIGAPGAAQARVRRALTDGRLTIETHARGKER